MIVPVVVMKVVVIMLDVAAVMIEVVIRVVVTAVALVAMAVVMEDGRAVLTPDLKDGVRMGDLCAASEECGHHQQDQRGEDPPHSVRWPPERWEGANVEALTLHPSPSV